MSIGRFHACIAGVMVIVLCSAASADERPAANHSTRRDQKKEVPQRSKPANAAPQPSVSCDNQGLSIAAQDAPLADILSRVGNCTGAVIEAPPDATDRISVHLGPGPAVRVLTDLLSGTRFNYVIAGVPNNASAIRSIQLSVRPTTPAPPLPPAPPETPVASDASVRSDLTGGDEGVWDNVEVGTPVAAPPAAEGETAPTKPAPASGSQAPK